MVDIKKKHKGQRHYYAHDNGGRPFIVYFSKTMVYVYRVPKDTEDDIEGELEQTDYTELVFKKRFSKKFIGDDKNYPPSFAKGNSILVKTGVNTYVFIGHEIYSFRTTDSIVKYYSLIGNSDVPYPVALGKDSVFFMLDKEYISRDDVDPTFSNWIDAYSDIYYTDEFKTKAMKSVKAIKKRLW